MQFNFKLNISDDAPPVIKIYLPVIYMLVVIIFFETIDIPSKNDTDGTPYKTVEFECRIYSKFHRRFPFSSGPLNGY